MNYPAADQIKTQGAKQIKPAGAVTIDVDTLHSLFDGYDSPKDVVYDRAIPRYLDLLDEYQIKSTLFVVSNDLNRNTICRERVREAHDRGHEIACHSHSHFQGFGWLTKEEQYEELSVSKKTIEDTIGDKVIGFRSPGWNVTKTTLDILEQLDFKYDSSVLPSYFNLVFKLFHWSSTSLLRDKRKRTTLGPMKNSFANLKPYMLGEEPWQEGNRKLVEFPISVIPFFRIPFFGTFLFGPGKGCFDWGLDWIKSSSQTLNFEWHGVEFLDYETDQVANELKGIKGQYIPHTLSMKFDIKKAFIQKALNKFNQEFEIKPLAGLVKF